METYEYRFRWLKVGEPQIVEVEKTIYAPDLEDAKKQVSEEWPALDLGKAMVERIKANGEGLPLQGE